MKRNKYNAICYFVFALVLAYAVDWIPHYVSWFSQGDIAISGTIQKFRTSCTEKENEKVRCTDSFRIPSHELDRLPKKHPSVGLGILISGTEIYCTGSPERKLTYGDIESGSRALELLRTFQTVDLDALNCEGDLIVNVWGPKSYRRSGYIGGPLVFGDLNEVNQVKRAIEFFTVEINLVIFGGLLACILITRFLLGSAVKTSQSRTEFEDFAGEWAAFGFLKSGVPEVALPIISGTLLYVRVANFLSSAAHLGPALLFLARYAYSPAWMKQLSKKLTDSREYKFSRVGLYSVLLAITISPYFAKWLGIMTAIASVLCVVRKPKDYSWTFTLFAVAAGIETAKLFNFRYTPYGSTTLLFVSFLLFERFLANIKVGSRVISTLNWSRNLSVPKDVGDLESLLENIGRRFGIRKISLIEPKTGGSSFLITLKFDLKTERWSGRSYFLEKIPPVFSHVLTTRDPLWNVHQESDLAFQLRKGIEKNVSDFEGAYFTVLPILKENVPVAALGFTSYDNSLMNELSRRGEFETAMNVVAPLIGECVWARNLAQSDEWYRLCVEVSAKILKISDRTDSSLDLKNVMIETAKIIHESTGFSIFLSRVNPITREYDLKVTSGFSEEVASLYANTGFYALQGNTQGPMPLAINRGRVVTVADLTWLFSVLHPASLKILKLSECRSAAAVPVMAPEQTGNDFEKVWGLIWFESLRPGTFLPSHEAGLKIIAAALESVLSQTRLNRRAKDALKGLVRDDIAKKLLDQKSVREVDRGYLLVADIRGSTQIANEVGVDAWNSFVDLLRPQIASLASHYKLRLEMIVWDAFFLTRTEREPDSSVLIELIEFSKKMNMLLEMAYRDMFPDKANFSDGVIVRICVEYGDTTRDIQNGNWTIVGLAMAKVCKLESVCKPLSGWFFLPERLKNVGSPFVLTEVLHPSTKEKVVVLEMPIDAGLTQVDAESLRVLQLSARTRFENAA